MDEIVQIQIAEFHVDEAIRRAVQFSDFKYTNNIAVRTVTT
jgi:hypothetical protein